MFSLKRLTSLNLYVSIECCKLQLPSYFKLAALENNQVGKNTISITQSYLGDQVNLPLTIISKPFQITALSNYCQKLTKKRSLNLYEAKPGGFNYEKGYAKHEYCCSATAVEKCYPESYSFHLHKISSRSYFPAD